MPKKTPFMEQYENENPGKNAIWNGCITEQFKIWKAQRTDPNFRAKYLYEGRDGFKIERKTWLPYYAELMRTAVERYGLSDAPDWKILEEIGTIIFEYICRPTFRIGYPVYCNEI